MKIIATLFSLRTDNSEMKALSSLRDHCKPYVNHSELACLHDIVFKDVWIPVGWVVWEQVRTQVIKTLKEGNTNGNV